LDDEAEKNRILEKMFEAAVKEKLRQLSRQYDRQTVFNIWVEMAKTESLKIRFGKGAWEPGMTIAQALDCVDGYCHFFEEKLRGKHPEKKDKE
jgi:hypothetical protein